MREEEEPLLDQNTAQSAHPQPRRVSYAATGPQPATARRLGSLGVAVNTLGPVRSMNMSPVHASSNINHPSSNNLSGSSDWTTDISAAQSFSRDMSFSTNPNQNLLGATPRASIFNANSAQHSNSSSTSKSQHRRAITPPSNLYHAGVNINKGRDSNMTTSGPRILSSSYSSLSSQHSMAVMQPSRHFNSLSPRAAGSTASADSLGLERNPSSSKSSIGFSPHILAQSDDLIFTSSHSHSDSTAKDTPSKAHPSAFEDSTSNHGNDTSSGSHSWDSGPDPLPARIPSAESEQDTWKQSLPEQGNPRAETASNSRLPHLDDSPAIGRILTDDFREPESPRPVPFIDLSKLEPEGNLFLDTPRSRSASSNNRARNKSGGSSATGTIRRRFRTSDHHGNPNSIMDDTEDEDRESNQPFSHRNHMDFSNISEYLTSVMSNSSADLYDSFHSNQAETAPANTSWRHRSSLSGRNLDRGEYYYQQKSMRFMFHSDVTETVRSPLFETLPLASYESSIAEILQAGTFWLDVCNPTAEEMNTLTRLFKIHPLSAEDIMTEETREKCEAFPNYYFIAIRTFDSDQFSATYMQPINVYIIVFRECVLSFHSQPIVHLNNVLNRVEQLKVYGLNISPDWLNYALIDDITDGFMPSLRHIELEVDAIDELVLILKEREQSDMLRRIGHARKRVMVLLRLLITKADVIKAVIKRCGQRLAPESETTLYLGDIQDHIITMVQTLNHCDKTLTRSHSNYLAQISIEITQASNRTNDVVLKMTALASILVPLNIITGLWGMNVRVPGEESEGLAWFFVVLGLMVVVAIVSFMVVRRHNIV
ncbi:CorA metal ion transporter [Chytriomyces hyalinus]|nr:CorA metal ion transporter [Chytriomyces hyalinus]